MTKAIVMFLLGALTLAAADVTGTWTGSLKATRGDGGEHTDTAHLVLKQEGSAVTGFAGGNPSDQHEISEGKVEGDQFSFRLVNGEMEMRVTLKLNADGNKMTGQIQRERNGVVQTAQLELTKSK